MKLVLVVLLLFTLGCATEPDPVASDDPRERFIQSLKNLDRCDAACWDRIVAADERAGRQPSYSSAPYLAPSYERPIRRVREWDMLRAPNGDLYHNYGGGMIQGPHGEIYTTY